ncbi:hypothetical protein LOAG_13652 [Loa loa]|nr:hypothetical protein LOAG_13652 [Loa loa]EFO14863.1 hypothetical protein LOAG_13652 [Loa loa]
MGNSHDSIIKSSHKNDLVDAMDFGSLAKKCAVEGQMDMKGWELCKLAVKQQ